MSATLLLIEDDDLQRRTMGAVLRVHGNRVHAVEDAESGWEILATTPVDLVLCDLTLPGMHGLDLLERVNRLDADLPVLMISGGTSIDDALTAIRRGAWDYLQKPVPTERLLKVIDNALKQTRMSRQLERETSTFAGMIAQSPAMREVFSIIRRISRYDATALIIGESGVGKELVARAIHQESRRNNGPFVAFNAAAISDNLFESTLFGHEKGAFTGAVQRSVGLMVQAEGGTLFIDEAGEMSLAHQAKLLRALEARRIRPVGSPREIPIDVRVVAATNSDLQAAIDAGQFREDLYYRLHGVRIRVPPLRERPEDILALAHAFLHEAREQHGVPVEGFTEDARLQLTEHTWPGNVRELKQSITSAALLAEGRLVTASDLGFGTESSEQAESQPNIPVQTDPGVTLLADAEKLHVQRILDMLEGNRSRAARLLGVSRSSLYRLLEKHEL